MKTVLLMATTLDGKIGRTSSHLVDWTGKEDRKMFVRFTKEAGVVIMGYNTFYTIGKALPQRKNIVMTRKRADTPDSPELVFTDKHPAAILNDLEAEGFQTAALIGGAQINSLFLKERLIDEVSLTVVPRIFGDGLSMFCEETDIILEHTTTAALDRGEILLEYTVSY